MKYSKLELALIRRSETIFEQIESAMLVLKDSKTVEINSSSHFMEIVSRRVRPWLIWELIDNGFNLEDNNIATYVEFNNFIEDYLKERYGHEMDGFYRWRIKDRTK
jgi:hypothetical protein